MDLKSPDEDLVTENEEVMRAEPQEPYTNNCRVIVEIKGFYFRRINTTRNIENHAEYQAESR